MTAPVARSNSYSTSKGNALNVGDPTTAFSGTSTGGFTTPLGQTPSLDTSAPGAATRIAQSDLTYIGSMRGPTATISGTSNGQYEGGNWSCAYNPSNHSLFMCGRTQRVGEFALTTFSTSPTFSSWPIGSVIQTAIEPTEGGLEALRQSLITAQYPTPENFSIQGVHKITSTEILVQAWIYYNANGRSHKSFWRRPLNLSTTGQVSEAMEAVNTSINASGITQGVTPGAWGRYMCAIPSDWQASFGAPMFSGGGGGSAQASHTSGPSFFPYDPDNLSPSSALTIPSYLYYPLIDKVFPPANPVVYWSNASSVGGAAFPSGRRSVLYLVASGAGEEWYGLRTDHVPADTYRTAKEYHCPPYLFYIFEYDVLDLLAVKAGTMSVSDPVPNVWALNLPNDNGAKYRFGMTFDEVNRNLYVVTGSNASGSTGNYPVVHAFHLT